LTSRFVTEIQGDQFPGVFDAFEEAVGADAWLKRTRALDAEIRGKPLLAEHIRSENRVAYALQGLTEQKKRNGRLTEVRVESPADYETYALVTQSMSLFEVLPKAAARRLARRLNGAFRNPDDLRGLQFEWLIATHLVERRFAIEFPTEAEGTFDFVATQDGLAVDVECKSISPDKGRPIHRRDAFEIYSLLLPTCRAFAMHLRKGLLVRVTVPRRLPTSHRDRQHLSDQIRRCIVSGRDVTDADLEVRLFDFDVGASPLLPYPPSLDRLREFFERQFGIQNRELFTLYSNSDRAIVICLESRIADRPIDATMDSVKDAADRQLSGNRAGVVCVKFEDLTSDELAEIGAESGRPSGLRIAASNLLNARRTSHLVCLAFFADGPVRQIADNTVTRGGLSYFFENRDSTHYSAAVAAAFRDLS
jgi:hypothetical protein